MNPIKSEAELRKQIVSELLQFKAELSQGLNQLATGKNATELSADRFMALITSLIKELVAEVKPDKRELIEPITGNPVSRGDKVTVDVEADQRGSLIFVQNNGYNMALDQFEQNLLKALESKK